jgi:flagellar protein FlbD
MVILTTLNNKEIMVNDDLIESGIENPDTVITMNNGHTYLVKESLSDIYRMSAEYRRIAASKPLHERIDTMDRINN